LVPFGLTVSSPETLETNLDNGDIIEGIRVHLEERKLGQARGKETA